MKISEKDTKDGARWFQAEEGGELVGFAVSSKKDGFAVLDLIHIIPGLRKKGVGTALLNRVLGWAKKQGINEVVGEFFPEFRGGEDEKSAREFYNKRGFTIDENNNLRGRIK